MQYGGGQKLKLSNLTKLHKHKRTGEKKMIEFITANIDVIVISIVTVISAAAVLIWAAGEAFQRKQRFDK